MTENLKDKTYYRIVNEFKTLPMEEQQKLLSDVLKYYESYKTKIDKLEKKTNFSEEDLSMNVKLHTKLWKYELLADSFAKIIDDEKKVIYSLTEKIKEETNVKEKNKTSENP